MMKNRPFNLEYAAVSDAALNSNWIAESSFQMGTRRSVSLRSMTEGRAPARPTYPEGSFGKRTSIRRAIFHY
jgi:hypothetical protein